MKAKLAIEIYNEFIKDGGRYELNLSVKDKQPIREEFERKKQLSDTENCRVDDGVFSNLEKIIHLSLKEATFPNFIQSSKFRDFAMQQTTDFLDKIGTRSSVRRIDIIQRLSAIRSGLSPSASEVFNDSYREESPFGMNPNIFNQVVEGNCYVSSEGLGEISNITMDDFRFLLSKVFSKEMKKNSINEIMEKCIIEIPEPTTLVDDNGRRQSTPFVQAKPVKSERSKSLSSPVTSPMSKSGSFKRYSTEELNRASSVTSMSSVNLEYFEDIWTESEKKSNNYILTTYNLKSSAVDSDPDYVAALKNIHIFKTEVEYPYRADFVVETLTKSQYRIEFDNMLKESFNLEFNHLHSPPCEREIVLEEVASTTLEEVWQFSSFGFMSLRDRSFVVEASLIYDESNGAYILLKKSVDTLVIDDTDAVRGRILQGTIFEKKSKEKTLLTDFVLIDMKDSVKSIIFENCVAKRAKDLYDRGLAALKKNNELVQLGFPTPSDSDRIYETLMENRKAEYATLGMKIRAEKSVEDDDFLE